MTDPQHGSTPSEGPDTTTSASPETPTAGESQPGAAGYPPPGAAGYPPPGAPSYPPPGAPGYPPPYPPPYPGAYYDPTAPYGREPFTGEPYSDKSKLVAGLLQLLGVFGLVGFGRIYLGQTGLGIAQLIVGIVTCFVGAVIWGIVDAILIFSGNVRDTAGRPLRDGA